MRQPTNSIYPYSSCKVSLMVNLFLRSCHLVVQSLFCRAIMRTLASQSPPKMCLCGLIKSSESQQQISLSSCLLQAGSPKILLMLCIPHNKEKELCGSKQFPSIWALGLSITWQVNIHKSSKVQVTIINGKTKWMVSLTKKNIINETIVKELLVIHLIQKISETLHEEVNVPLFISERYKQSPIHLSIVFFLFSLTHSSFGISTADGLSNESARGLSCDSSFFTPLILRFGSVPFLHIRMIFFTSGQPRRYGSLMTCEKYASNFNLRFSIIQELLFVFCQK